MKRILEFIGQVYGVVLILHGVTSLISFPVLSSMSGTFIGRSFFETIAILFFGFLYLIYVIVLGWKLLRKKYPKHLFLLLLILPLLYIIGTLADGYFKF